MPEDALFTGFFMNLNCVGWAGVLPNISSKQAAPII